MDDFYGIKSCLTEVDSTVLNDVGFYFNQIYGI